MKEITITKEQFTEAMADATRKVTDQLESKEASAMTVMIGALINAEACHSLFREEEK